MCLHFTCCESYLIVSQAEKDAKRKARAKELKKLRKAKEKKVQVLILHLSPYMFSDNEILMEALTRTSLGLDISEKSYKDE